MLGLLISIGVVVEGRVGVFPFFKIGYAPTWAWCRQIGGLEAKVGVARLTEGIFVPNRAEHVEILISGDGALQLFSGAKIAASLLFTVWAANILFRTGLKDRISNLRRALLYLCSLILFAAGVALWILSAPQ